MADYLQMDGVDDYFLTPSITFNKIVMDIYVHYRTSGAWTCLLSSSSANLTYNTSGGQSSGGINTPPIVNGSGSYTITNDTRNTIEVTTSAATVTESVYLFSNVGSSDFAESKVYDVKFYNGATLVAWYDMTAGNVNDQSGNGKHAAMTGGTWVGSSTPVSVTSVVANATAVANNHVVTTQRSKTIVSVIANVTASANTQAVSVQRSVSVSGVIANANPAVLVPVVNTSRNAAITSVFAAGTAVAFVPVISTTANKVIAAVSTNATASSLNHAVSTGVNVEILPTVVNATNAALNPVISTGSNVQHVSASSTASANPPIIGAVTFAFGVVASATGQSLAPSVTTQKQVDVVGVAATSVAAALAPIVAMSIPNVVIQGKSAIASVLALIPSLVLNIVAFVRSVDIAGSLSVAIELRGEIAVEPSRPPIYLEGDATTAPKELRGEV